MLAIVLSAVDLLGSELEAVFSRFPDLVSLEVVSEGRLLATRDRGKEVEESTEAKLEVRRPLGDMLESPELVAVFATQMPIKDAVLKILGPLIGL